MKVGDRVRVMKEALEKYITRAQRVDVDRGVIRTFAVNDIQEWSPDDGRGRKDE